ncbi:MAG: hypothetical protein AAF311_16670 [Pseudomonadota bacterium]
MEKLLAVWRFAVALLLYPTAFIALIWIWWTGRSVFWGLAVLILVLVIDRVWIDIARAWARRLFRK